MFRLREMLRKYKRGELSSLDALLVQTKLKMDMYERAVRKKLRKKLAEKGIDVEFLEEREKFEDFIDQLEEERQSRIDAELFGRKRRRRRSIW